MTSQNIERVGAVRRRQVTQRGYVLGVAALFVGLAGCDTLLDVSLPDAVTDEALENPVGATTQVLSVIGEVECAYSAFTVEASGYEDGFQATAAAVGAGYADYSSEAGEGNCDAMDSSYNFLDSFQIARAFGYQAYDRITAWTPEELGPQQNKERLLALTALYVGISLDVFGEHFCDIMLDGGPIMNPGEALGLADEWVTTALGHLDMVGDFAGENGSTESVRTMAYGVRARIHWANGDLAGAAADAAMVPDGYVAYSTREEAVIRRNKAYNTHTAVKYGLVNDAVDYWQGDPNPVTGQAWPAVIPFTGYIDLAILPDGRAVDASGYPITTAAAGAVADSRIPLASDQEAQGGVIGFVPMKWTGLGDDIPMVNWKEMRLIRAEAEPDQAVAHVNAVRGANGLPLVTYGPTGEEVRNLIVEERRRALWLEGRFWSTKILNTDKLWFPRLEGFDRFNHQMLGGVRLVYPLNEYRLNPNVTEDDRGSGCMGQWENQRPELGLGTSV
ncbi:MAG: hypothetical protein GEU90_11510 [Gemmatimonas sp.]|nr:hypothetical protein [Gemmatimonas sp.]